eukprot:scaffold94850_cov18-Prasinocladus_malaysianus.AAC.1
MWNCSTLQCSNHRISIGFAGAQVDTSWCRHSQFHTAVAYRGLLRAVAAGGPLELSAAIAGSVYEGMEILIRNAE